MGKNAGVFIYTLTDENDEPFYVGQTVQRPPTKRYDQHMLEARSGHNSEKCNVIRSIWDRGSSVGFNIIEEVPKSDADEAEREWIGFLVAQGFSIENILLMPQANDEVVAQAYSIINEVLSIPEIAYLRQIIISLDIDIDYTDNLMAIRDNLLASVIILAERGFSSEEILRSCRDNFWEYCGASDQIKMIITDNTMR